MSELSDYNISEICRTCLVHVKNSELKPIYGKSRNCEIPMIDMLIECAKVQINEFDGLPSNVCTNCANDITNAYKFKVKCEQNEKLLLRYMVNKTKKPPTHSSTYQNYFNINSKNQYEKDENDKMTNTGKTFDSILIDNYTNKNESQIETKLRGGSPMHERCNQLNINYQSNKQLQRGFETSSGSKKSQNSENLARLDLQKHLVKGNISTKDKSIECKICTQKFNRIYKLREHIKCHINNVDPELCKFLQSIGIIEPKEDIHALLKISNDFIYSLYSIFDKFGNEFTLSDSETETDSDSPIVLNRNVYLCEICNESFDRQYKIICHQNDKHDSMILPHICKYCGKKYIAKILLEHHLKLQCENRQKTYECSKCLLKFQWLENLETHKNTNHLVTDEKFQNGKKQKSKNYFCSWCNKSFYRQDHLDRHTTIHQPDKNNFECTICNRKFNRKDNMKSHMKIHCDEREKNDKHLCVYCGRSFSNSSNLIVHMRRHTGEKPYKCDICEKGFPRSSDLQCHRRTHTGEKPCLCTICGKGFSRSNKLVRHMRIHTGSKPYKCTYCDRAFTQSNDLTLHIRRHTGDKPYVCNICGDRFIQGTALQTHRRLKGHLEDTSKAIIHSNPLNFENDQLSINRLNSALSKPREINTVEYSSNNKLLLMNLDSQHTRTFNINQTALINEQYKSNNVDFFQYKSSSNFVPCTNAKECY